MVPAKADLCCFFDESIWLLLTLHEHNTLACTNKLPPCTPTWGIFFFPSRGRRGGGVHFFALLSSVSIISLSAVVFQSFSSRAAAIHGSEAWRGGGSGNNALSPSVYTPELKGLARGFKKRGCGAGREDLLCM